MPWPACIVGYLQQGADTEDYQNEFYVGVWYALVKRSLRSSTGAKNVDATIDTKQIKSTVDDETYPPNWL